MRDYTFIYSSPSVEALENLVKSFLTAFNIPNTIDEMFEYGVFCKPETYANFDLWDEAPLNLCVPENLTSVCSKPSDRMNYVKMIIKQVIKGEIEKPEWMIYVEETKSCNEFDDAPSTFLTIIPKSEEYKDLGEKLIEFLYSPNLLITMVNEKKDRVIYGMERLT